MSATELVCAAPSQQRLRRSSDSVAAATPSQLRRSSAARTMSGRRGIGRSSPSGKFANFWAKTGVTHHDTNLVFPIRKRTVPIVAASLLAHYKFKVIISAPCEPKIDLIEHRRHGRDHCSTRVWAGVHCRTVSVSASVQAALRGQPSAAPSSCVGAADCTAAATRISSI